MSFDRIFSHIFGFPTYFDCKLKVGTFLYLPVCRPEATLQNALFEMFFAIRLGEVSYRYPLPVTRCKRLGLRNVYSRPTDERSERETERRRRWPGTECTLPAWTRSPRSHWIAHAYIRKGEQRQPRTQRENREIDPDVMISLQWYHVVEASRSR
jgi:hypothetical protein